MTRLLMISGSTADGSLQTSALRTAARLAPPGITAVVYDGLRHLPAFVPGEAAPAQALAVREAIAAADAVLFCTPEYAGSLPGSLKNLLDHVVAGGELGGKPVAWLSVATPGGDEGAREALETVLAQCNARLLHAACQRIPLVPHAVDGEGMVTQPQLHQALADMLETLTRTLTQVQTRQAPSWQINSSLFPTLSREGDRPTFRPRRPF
jgi:chromate reductase, NAD(P)H dehydrogenase (quinone)